MNAIELYLSDGRSANIFYCEKCCRVHPWLVDAEACCRPKKCACGADVISIGWTVCKKCRTVNEQNHEAERYAAAEKVPADLYAGPVFADIGPNNGYFATVDELLEYLADVGEPTPNYVWACRVFPVVNLDCDDIIERATEEANEDWDSRCLVGVAELEAAMKAFNEANKAHTTWEADYTRAVLVPKQAVEQKGK